MAQQDNSANKDDYIEKLVAVNRVAKVVKGGRQFGFTALTRKQWTKLVRI
jgi:small subunit ribosomal protein S5